MSPQEITQALRLERMKARARGNPPSLHQQNVELQRMMLAEGAEQTCAMRAMLREAKLQTQAFEGIRERLDPRALFTAAALAGISAHAVGPGREPCETPADAHARWATVVGRAAARKAQA